MPYRTQKELDEDRKRNPKLAKVRIAKAKQAGIPVVSSKNPGYGDSAGYPSGMIPPKTDRKDMTAAVSRRMANNSNKKKPEEDETVAKRKRVGY